MLERLQARLIAFLLKKIDATTSVLTSYRAELSHMDLGAVERPHVHKDELTDKIRLLVRLRWGMDLMVPATLLLLAAQGLQLTNPSRHFETSLDYLKSMWPNWCLAASGLGINVIYQVLLRRRRNLRPIAYAQVWLDILIFSLMIFNTGGVGSPFAFLFTVPVLAAGMLLSFRAGLAAAATSTALMALMGSLHYSGVLTSKRYFIELAPLLHSRNYMIVSITLNGVLYLLIAVATGALVSTIHKHEKALAVRANEATMLAEVSSILQSTTDLTDVLNRIMDTLLIRLHIDHGLMYLVNEAGDALELTVERFHPRIDNPPYGHMKVRMELKREAGLTAICALDKQAFNVTDHANHPLINRELALKLGINPFAVAPMLGRGNVVGVVGIDRRFQNTIITQEEAQILFVAGNQAGLTIQNARLYADAKPK